MKLLHEFTDGDCFVKLEQYADGKFRVTYGLQVMDKLSYEGAAHKYGECVLHSLACAGKLDND